MDFKGEAFDGVEGQSPSPYLPPRVPARWIDRRPRPRGARPGTRPVIAVLRAEQGAGAMTYRILALDGGGSWAVLQVMALAAIHGDTATGHEVLRHFDLVAANSGGSITLGGLIENRTLADLRDNFFRNETERRRVFVEKGGLAALMQNLVHVGPKYSAPDKLTGLKTLLKASGGTQITQLRHTLGEWLPDLVICTFDYDRLRGILFRSNRASRAASFTPEIDPTLAEAIHASTNAPVNYFDRPADLPEHAPTRQFWDGGVAGYNNPVLLAVMEALANGHAAGEIRALSLGTGTTFLPFDPGGTLGPLGQPRRGQPRGNGLDDLLSDVQTLATAIVDDPPDIASYLAHIALGGAMPRDQTFIPVSGPVVRLNPMIQPVRGAGGAWVAPPGVSDFAKLAALDMDAVAQADVNRIVEFGTAWLANHVTNQAIRCNRTTLECEIGQPTFDRALAVWNSFG